VTKRRLSCQRSNKATPFSRRRERWRVWNLSQTTGKGWRQIHSKERTCAKKALGTEREDLNLRGEAEKRFFKKPSLTGVPGRRLRQKKYRERITGSTEKGGGRGIKILLEKINIDNKELPKRIARFGQKNKGERILSKKKKLGEVAGEKRQNTTTESKNERSKADVPFLKS